MNFWVMLFILTHVTGMTYEPEIGDYQIITNPAEPEASFVLPLPYDTLTYIAPEGLILQPMDSLTLHVQIPEGESVVLRFNSSGISVVELPETLSTLAQQAIDVSPSWLQHTLEDNFRRLGEYADTYALIILNVDPQLRDEVAFQVAHIGAEILTDSIFDPELIVVNAELIYAYDDSLQYVELVEYPEYTTTRYKVVVDGDTIDYELPFPYYYYYIVHPELSDEIPRMDEYVYNRFWRDYLFNEADSGYPKLSAVLKHTKVLWEVTDTAQVYPGSSAPFDSTDPALVTVGRWVSYTLPELAWGNRPIQPNVIAHEHNGNCGEVQDLLQAAARTALIPVDAHFSIAEDHVWNAFYCYGWHEYQVDRGGGVVHLNDWRTAYDVDWGGSKQVSSVMAWRSDGLTETVTPWYSNACSLYVQVLDARGMPIDGARVLLYSEYLYGGYAISCWKFTTPLGMTAFTVGNLRNIYLQIRTPLGTYPDENTIMQIIYYGQTGGNYYKTLYLPYIVPFVRVVPAGAPTDTTNPYAVDIELTVPYKILHGYAWGRRNTGDANPIQHTYSEEEDGGTIDMYIFDSLGYATYAEGEVAPAYYIGDNLPAETLSFTAPYESDWYIVLSNKSSLSTTCGVDIKVRLSSKSMLVEQVSNPKLNVRMLTKGIAVEHRQPIALKLYDLTGRTVATREFTQPGHHLWQPNVSAGIYFVHIKQGDNLTTYKWVKLGR